MASAQISAAREIASSSFSIVDMLSKGAMISDHLWKVSKNALQNKFGLTNDNRTNLAHKHVLSQFKLRADKSVWSNILMK